MNTTVSTASTDFNPQTVKKPVSEAKLEANRANAQKSTGPKTPEGKAASSRNAVTHGLLANAALTAREDPEEFAAFRDGLLRGLKPVGEVEQILAERVVSGYWRLRRTLRIESELFEQDSDGGIMQWILTNAKPKALGAIFKAYSGERDTLGRLARYETAIDRTTSRAHHELQRLQAARAGKDVPPPVAVDVDVALHHEAPAVPSPAQASVETKRAAVDIDSELEKL